MAGARAARSPAHPPCVMSGPSRSTRKAKRCDRARDSDHIRRTCHIADVAVAASCRMASFLITTHRIASHLIMSHQHTHFFARWCPCLSHCISHPHYQLDGTMSVPHIVVKTTRKVMISLYLLMYVCGSSGVGVDNYSRGSDYWAITQGAALFM